MHSAVEGWGMASAARILRPVCAWRRRRAEALTSHILLRIAAAGQLTETRRVPTWSARMGLGASGTTRLRSIRPWDFLARGYFRGVLATGRSGVGIRAIGTTVARSAGTVRPIRLPTPATLNRATTRTGR